MEKRMLTCIVCPLGCTLEVELEGDNFVSITGNSCKRGEAYARSECISPKRVLTTTVKAINGKYNVVSVKSAEALPKELLIECMREIDKVCVEGPIHIGDIIIKNICKTSVDIIATKNN